MPVLYRNLQAHVNAKYGKTRGLECPVPWKAIVGRDLHVSYESVSQAR